MTTQSYVTTATYGYVAFSEQFTGKERDAESGLDYFGARYLSSPQGRFTSPDVPLLDQQPGDPQSWNLYSYVRNNPLIFTDPTGNDCVYVNSGGNGIDSINNQGTSKDCGKTGGYWVDGTVTDVKFSHGGVHLRGTTDGNDRTFASYSFQPGPVFEGVRQGVLMSEPGVNLAGQGLMLFGSIVAPLPMAISSPRPPVVPVERHRPRRRCRLRSVSWSDSSAGGGTATVAYDGDGRRVSKTSSVSGTTTYVYDPAGNLAVEVGGVAATTSSTVYLTADHLGSTRLVTGANGGCVGAHDYLPFGEEVPVGWGRSGVGCYSLPDAATVKFTGQERDSESGLDNFVARMMAGAQGRFLSQDPDNYDARLEQPQSWNMYGYTWNNPVRYSDRDGRAVNLLLAGAGAGIGFTTGFVGSAIAQEIEFGTVDLKTAGAYGIGGAVAGATAGFTFGGSVILAAAADVSVAAAGNVVGGITSRALAGQDAFDSDALESDATVGLVGGAVGEAVGSLYRATNLPAAPKPFFPLSSVTTRLQRLARFRAFERLRAQIDFRGSAIGATAGSLVTNVAAQVVSAYEGRNMSSTLRHPEAEFTEYCCPGSLVY